MHCIFLTAHCCIPQCLGRADSFRLLGQGSDQNAAVHATQEFIREVYSEALPHSSLACHRAESHIQNARQSHTLVARLVGQTEPCPHTGSNYHAYSVLCTRQGQSTETKTAHSKHERKQNKWLQLTNTVPEVSFGFMHTGMQQHMCYPPGWMLHLKSYVPIWCYPLGLINLTSLGTHTTLMALHIGWLPLTVCSLRKIHIQNMFNFVVFIRWPPPPLSDDKVGKNSCHTFR
jgi:hypothetical protein